MIARFVCLLVLVASPHASADKASEAKAQALFEAGRALIEAGKIDDACERFVESQQLDPQVGTKLNIADCRIRQSRLVEAYDLFVEAKTEPKASPYHVNYASKKIEELEQKLVRITIVAADADVTVRLGIGDKLDEKPSKGWDNIVVAPGKLSIVATAPGRKPYRSQQDVVAGKRVTIAVPLLEVEPRRKIRAPVVIGAVGGGLVLVSFGLGLHARSRYNTAVDNLDPSGVDSAQTEADVATGFLVVGAAAVTIGAVMYFQGRRTQVSVSPIGGGSSVGIVFGGRY